MASTLRRSRRTLVLALVTGALTLSAPGSAEETEASPTQTEGSLAAAPAKAAPPEVSVQPEPPAQQTVRGKVYASHQAPGTYAFETPDAWHGHPRHGLELGAHWDRTWPPHGTAYTGYGPRAPWPAAYPYGLAPWPLSNLDIEVNPE